MKNKIIVAGGCFWGVQAFFDQIDGVHKTEVGYMHGKGDNPSYEQVCNSSGHVEAVSIEFDSSKQSLDKILEYYWAVIDPYSLNKQGNDKGIQYRTGIYYYDDNQEKLVKDFLKNKQEHTDKKIMVEAQKVRDWFSAENYHQKYLEKNPDGYCHIDISKSLKKVGLK